MCDVNIKELALQAVDAMLEAGFKPFSAWNEYETSYAPIVRLHNKYGQEKLNTEIVSEYVQFVNERFDRGEIGNACRLRLIHGAKRLTGFNDIGKIEWSTKAVKSKLTAYYENILGDILSCQDWNEKVRECIYGHARRYFAWLIQEEHYDLNNVYAEVIQEYILRCSRRMGGSGLSNVKYYLKKLYCYLEGSGCVTDKYESLFSFPVSMKRKIQPAVSQEELSATLNAIDRSTSAGKRDYAAILLGAVTGLRAIDISKLKLTDIDWCNGEIHIVQEKTGKPLILPLTKDVGEAVREYILNSRPKCNSENVFLRVNAPIREFACGSGIGNIYVSARKKADLPHGTFHALRRAVGRNMVTSGVPVSTVAQVLGHTDIDSTKQYISLDSNHLKECALDFVGIAPERSDA